MFMWERICHVYLGSDGSCVFMWKRLKEHVHYTLKYLEVQYCSLKTGLYL